MAGIYIHIPFCKVKCNYCDFHFSTQHSYLSKMTQAICKELILKTNYLNGEIKTIYFGGGTPSILPEKDLIQIVNTIYNHYKVNPNIEFTFECNPDDITNEKLNHLKQVGVNRLSIGIQSFDNTQLEFMNRAHNANEAENCVTLAQKNGFDNITVDLIYGLPNTDNLYWERQIKKVLNLNVNHISAYCLTIEDKTVFGSWAKKGKLKPLDEDLSLSQFKQLQKSLKLAGFEHYEISNFSKNNRISKHNSAYWLGEHYIGIGPSAHSFNGKTRQWNVAHNINYIKAIENNTNYSEIETLSPKDQFNEHILTRLRTKWGIDLQLLSNFNLKEIEQTIKQINVFIKNKHLKQENNIVTLTEKGKFIVDYITSELFV